MKKGKSAIEIFGHIVTNRTTLFQSSSEPKIFVTKKFSLADCRYLPHVAAIVVETIGSTEPAMLQIRNSGISCITRIPITFKKKGIEIGGGVFNEGDRVCVNLQKLTIVKYDGNKKNAHQSFKQQKDWRNVFYFINNLRQIVEITKCKSGAAVRSEDLIVNNPQASRSMYSFLTTSSTVALEKFHKAQRNDFCSIFSSLHDRPIMIRLLDSALSEFFPHNKQFKEKNIQLGNRGCRTFFTHRRLYEQHIRSIIQAAVKSSYRGEILIAVPFISLTTELAAIRKFFRQEVRTHGASDLRWKFGFTVETPRALLMLEKFTRIVQFINIGLNDLTQLMFGFSRDDAASFIPIYLEEGILEADPFVVPDKIIVDVICKKLKSVSNNILINIPVANSKFLRFWKCTIKQKNVRYLCPLNFK